MARLSKRKRAEQGRRPTGAPPLGGTGRDVFPFPEAGGGFTLNWLTPRDPDRAANQRMALFERQLPDDLEQRVAFIRKWSDRHPRGTQVPDAHAASLWHALHAGWRSDKQLGVWPFLQAEMRRLGFTRETLRTRAGVEVAMTTTALPSGRRSLPAWDRGHVLMALWPDGTFCRFLATHFGGAVALSLAEVRDGGARASAGEKPTVLGPVCVLIRGIPLSDGAPLEEVAARQPMTLLLDPACVVGDYGEWDRRDADGRYLFADSPREEVGRLYTCTDDPWYSLLALPTQRYFRMWRDTCPGFAGKLGPFARALARASTAGAGGRDGQREASRAAYDRTPISPVYAQALEHQLASMRFVEEQRPYATIRNAMRLAGTSRNSDAEADAIDGVLADALAHAAPHYWTRDMVRLLDATWSTLEEWTLDQTTIEDASGYVWFEDPISLIPGDPERVRALAWTAVMQQDGPVYMVIPFTIYGGTDQPAPETIVPVPVEGVPRRPMLWRLGDTLASWLKEIGEMYASPGMAAEFARVSGMTAEKDRVQSEAFGRVFATCLALMGQTLVITSRYRGDRATRKRAQQAMRLTQDADPPVVRAVLLRRRRYVRPDAGDGEPGDPVEWSCRWLVRPHWRRQFYRSTNQYKSILIAEYIKGPESKPLRITKPVKLVAR